MKENDIEITRISEIIKLGALVTGNSGNLSYRCGRNDYLITATGEDLRFLRSASFVQKKISEKQRGNASIEWRMHAFVYETSPSINSIFHFQSQYLTALSILKSPPGDKLKNLLPEIAIYIKKIRVVEYFTPGSKELALEVAREVQQGADALILKNHGAVVMGASLVDVIYKAEAFEYAARVLCSI